MTSLHRHESEARDRHPFARIAQRFSNLDPRGPAKFLSASIRGSLDVQKARGYTAAAMSEPEITGAKRGAVS
jgi:hypothetical protein